MTTGFAQEPICPVCKSKNCIGKYDSLYPLPETSACPYSGPEDRAQSVATFTLYDMSYNVVAVKCSACGVRAYDDTSWRPIRDFEAEANEYFRQIGWVMEDGQPKCMNCREF